MSEIAVLCFTLLCKGFAWKGDNCNSFSSPLGGLGGSDMEIHTFHGSQHWSPVGPAEIHFRAGKRGGKLERV